MDRRSSPADARKRRRRMTILWSLIFTLVVFLLLRYEQIALLYVLATLGVTALLFVVAFADLSGARKVTQTAPLDDSATIGDRTAAPLTTPALSASRSASKQR